MSRRLNLTRLKCPVFHTFVSEAYYHLPINTISTFSGRLLVSKAEKQSSSLSQCLLIICIWVIKFVFFLRWIEADSRFLKAVQTLSLRLKHTANDHTTSAITMKNPFPFRLPVKALWQINFKNSDLKICLFYWRKIFAFFHWKELVPSPASFLFGTFCSNLQKAWSSLIS